MAQQCDRSTERRRWGMFLFAAEEVVVFETQSLRCFQCVRGGETRPSL